MIPKAGPVSGPASFRDPTGSVFFHGERVLRRVHADAADSFESIAFGPAVSALVKSGRVISIRRITDDALAAGEGRLYEHERIPFVSCPAEWSPLMLADAAEFTLALALDLLDQGLMLKDATPANVLYRGSTPVLVDVPSIVERPAGSFIWLARNQFETCFLLPLMAAAECGLPIASSLADPVNGLSHAALARLLGGRRWRKLSLITAVALPAALAGKPASTHAAARAGATMDDRKARYILRRSFEQLRKQVRALRKHFETQTSAWQAYTDTRTHYADEDMALKRRFVEESLAACTPKWVLDVGANTGEFSEMAARHGSVVAVDVDETSVGRIFERARTRALDILPLTMNVARPTPAMGWRNSESPSFLARASGRFDAVLMLAVIHHLRVGAGVPLREIVALARDLTRGHLVIEYVPVTDPMFAQIARGREPLYGDCTRANFEALLDESFVIERSLVLPNQRVLYLARKKGA